MPHMPSIVALALVLVWCACGQRHEWLGGSGDWEDPSQWTPSAPTPRGTVVVTGEASRASVRESFAFESGGALEVVEDATVSVLSDVELVFDNGSALTVSGASLHLAENGVCIVNGGASVICTGEESVMDVQGELLVRDDMRLESSSTLNIRDRGRVFAEGALSVEDSGEILVIGKALFAIGAESADPEWQEEVEDLRGGEEDDDSEEETGNEDEAFEEEDIDEEEDFEDDEDDENDAVDEDSSEEDAQASDGNGEVAVSGARAVVSFSDSTILDVSDGSKLVLFGGELRLLGQHRSTMKSGDVEVFGGNFVISDRATMELGVEGSLETVAGDMLFAGESELQAIGGEIELSGGTIALSEAARWLLLGAEVSVNGGDLVLGDTAEILLTGPQPETLDGFFPPEGPEEEQGFMRADILRGSFVVGSSATLLLQHGSFVNVVGELQVRDHARMEMIHAQLSVARRQVCDSDMEQWSCSCSCSLTSPSTSSIVCGFGVLSEICSDRCEGQICHAEAVDEELVCGDCSGDCEGTCMQPGGYVTEQGVIRFSGSSHSALVDSRVNVDARMAFSDDSTVRTSGTEFVIQEGELALEDRAAAALNGRSSVVVGGSLLLRDLATLSLNEASFMFIQRSVRVGDSARLSLTDGSSAEVALGDITVEEFGSLSVSGKSTVRIMTGRLVVRDGGRVELEEGSAIVNMDSVTLSNSGMVCGDQDDVLISSSGVMTFEDRVTVSKRSGNVRGCTVRNRGMVNMCSSADQSGGVVDVDVDVPFENEGFALLCGAGTKRFANLSTASTGQLEIENSEVSLVEPLLNSGRLSGSFTARGHIVNEGVVAHGEGGVTRVRASTFTNRRSGSVYFALDGVDEPTNTRIDVDGEATLDGRLHLCINELFDVDQAESNGDRVEIMSFASRTGQFADIVFECDDGAHGSRRGVMHSKAMCSRVEYGSGSLAVLFGGCGGDSEPFHENVYLWLSVGFFVCTISMAVIVTVLYFASARFRVLFNGKNANREALIALRRRRSSFAMADLQSDGNPENVVV